ncbi:unnamed protein product [Phytophthora fragariaefolia]|uniref:Unnamed protein product n=1 Tax=Phytophthora fragariaefolia TaxID=1490495 RepID=A0A9W6Y871_9STRA|nr:unnamed protein product [Phytophthora fragariaefolia]
MVDQRDKDLKRMSEVLAERDVAYSALQGVVSLYFPQVQDAAAVISSGGADRAVRFANQTIDNQRRVIQRQKNVLRHNGRISVADPALALAAAAGIDAAGLSPGDLALNARLQWSRVTEFGSSLFATELGRADFQYVGCWVGYDSRRLPSAVGGALSSPWEPIPPRPLDPADPAVGARPCVESRSSLGVCSVGCPCHKLGGFGVPHGCDSAPESTARPLPAVSAGLVCSTPSSTRRTSSQAAKASAGPASKSARKSPAKAAAGSSRRAPPCVGLECRAINNLELQALEARDAKVLGWSSGAANSAARATSASSPLVVDSPSPLVVTPTPAPTGASSSQRQSSSDDSTDDEVALQRSRRLRRKSVVESDESSDSVAEALEEKPR